MSKLTGFGTPPIRVHDQIRCACGCGAYADRGLPGGRWYTTAHVPPHLRFAWERGACCPWPRVQAVSEARAASASQPDLFASTPGTSAPADAGFRPT